MRAVARRHAASLAELGYERSRRPARACGRSCISTGSSSPATSVTASSSSVTRCGKASRKKPEMRTVTSIRGRPSSSSGIGSSPTIRRVSGFQHRPHAEQREDLARVVAVRCASRPCPRRRSRRSRGSAVLVEVRPAARRPAGARLVGELATAAPGVDRVHVAARSAARRGARGWASPTAPPGRGARAGRRAGGRARRSSPAAAARPPRREAQRHDAASRPRPRAGRSAGS